MSMSAITDRQRLVRLIHVAKRDLALDDETYRAVLLRIGGKESSSDLAIAKLQMVLEHLKRSGFKVRSNPSKRPLADDAQSKMARGLWLQLANMGVVRNASEEALAAFVLRMTKVAALQWLSSDQASQLIEHLKEWRQRIVHEREKKLLHALQLPVLRLPVARDSILGEAVVVALGRPATMADLSSDEFQAVLDHHSAEVA